MWVLSRTRVCEQTSVLSAAHTTICPVCAVHPQMCACFLSRSGEVGVSRADPVLCLSR